MKQHEKISLLMGRHGLLSTEQSDNLFETNSAAEAVQKSPPTLSCRAQAVHPSLRSGRRPSPLRSGRSPQGETPRFARGD